MKNRTHTSGTRLLSDKCLDCRQRSRGCQQDADKTASDSSSSCVISQQCSNITHTHYHTTQIHWHGTQYFTSPTKHKRHTQHCTAQHNPTPLTTDTSQHPSPEAGLPAETPASPVVCVQAGQAVQPAGCPIAPHCHAQQPARQAPGRQVWWRPRLVSGRLLEGQRSAE
jgi:hypothetical protein